MTTLELEAKKAILAKQILSSDDEGIINKLAKLYNSLTAKYPCDYTEKEIIQGCEKAIQEYKEGKLIPHDQIKKKIS